MMRTTVRLDEQLLKSAKQYATETGTTLTAVIEDALRQALARRATNRSRVPVQLITVAGRGVRTGIDLSDSAALLAAMEEPDGSL